MPAIRWSPIIWWSPAIWWSPPIRWSIRSMDSDKPKVYHHWWSCLVKASTLIVWIVHHFLQTAIQLWKQMYVVHFLLKHIFAKKKYIYLAGLPIMYNIQAKNTTSKCILKLVIDFFSRSHSGYYFCRYWCLWILAYVKFGFGFALVNACLLWFRNPQWSGGTSEVIWGQYIGWLVVILCMMVVLYIM